LGREVRRNLQILLAVFVGLSAASGAQAATIAVTTTADVTAADGLCSLREAVLAARVDGPVQGCAAGTLGEDVVQLEAGEYRLAAGGANDDNNESGDLDTGPASTLRIVGRGMNATVIGAPVTGCSTCSRGPVSDWPT
jgi:CSLREA domain-containing protein